MLTSSSNPGRYPLASTVGVVTFWVAWLALSVFSKYLPSSPVWTVSTFVGCLALALVTALLTGFYMRRGRRAIRRERFLVCPKCQYSLKNLTDTGLCPECGLAYSPVFLHSYWTQDWTLNDGETRKSIPPDLQMEKTTGDLGAFGFARTVAVFAGLAVFIAGVAVSQIWQKQLGFLLNALILVPISLATMYFVWRFVDIRVRRGQNAFKRHGYLFCLNCEYPMSTLPHASICPECGAPFDPELARQHWKH